MPWSETISAELRVEIEPRAEPVDIHVRQHHTMRRQSLQVGFDKPARNALRGRFAQTRRREDARHERDEIFGGDFGGLRGHQGLHATSAVGHKTAGSLP